MTAATLSALRLLLRALTPSRSSMPDQALPGEHRAGEIVAGAVEADHKAIADQDVVPDALEVGDVLDPDIGAGRAAMAKVMTPARRPATQRRKRDPALAGRRSLLRSIAVDPNPMIPIIFLVPLNHSYADHFSAAGWRILPPARCSGCESHAKQETPQIGPFPGTGTVPPRWRASRPAEIAGLPVDSAGLSMNAGSGRKSAAESPCQPSAQSLHEGPSGSPSSRGLGHRPLTAATGVRIP